MPPKRAVKRKAAAPATPDSDDVASKKVKLIDNSLADKVAEDDLRKPHPFTTEGEENGINRHHSWSFFQLLQYAK